MLDYFFFFFFFFYRIAPQTTAIAEQRRTSIMDKQTVQEWLTWSFSPSISAIIITLLVSLLLPLLIHYYLYRSGVSTNIPAFLIAGPSGAGKTTLLTCVSSTRVSHPRCLRCV